MRPWERDYLPRTEDVAVYSYYDKYRNKYDGKYCEYCNEELGYDEDDELKDCDCEDAQESKGGKTNFPKLSRITLQSILDMLPEGVKPSDVKISISLDIGDMSIYGQELTFSYKKTFEADPEGFKTAQERYEKNYQAYLVEKKKYDEWKHQEEIKKLEEELARLKR
jgi:hypothetical protein